MDERPSGAVLRYRDDPSPAGPAEANRAMVLDAFDAIAAGDAGPFMALFDDDVVFHEAACLPYGGAHRGIAAARKAHAHIHECFDRLHTEIEQVVAAGDMVIAYLQLNFRVRKNGRSGRFPVAETYRFRDGRIIEWRAHYFDSRWVAGELNAPGRPAPDSGADGPPLRGRLLYREHPGSDAVAAENRAILAGAIDSVLAGDRDAYWAIYHPDAVFHEADCLPYGGAHRGIEAIKTGYGMIHQVFDGVHALFEELLAAGDIVIAYQQIDFRVRKNGRTGSFPVAELFRFRDGKVIEWRALYFDADMVTRALAAD